MASSALHTSSSRERERVSERASEREGSEDAGVASTTIAGLWGWLILILTYFLFVLSMYALVLSKLMPATGVPLLDAIKADTHYNKLIPVALLMVSFLWVYANWAALKFFKHN